MENQVSSVCFDYAAMTQRNIGFVTEDEQARLRKSLVFVCGAGGMGGACLQSLVRAGVGRFEIADLDLFEVSNLNRQVFASLSDVGQSKVETTRRKILDINPEAEVLVHGAEWSSKLDEILSRCKLVINGMDDIAAGILLYRKAKEHGATVIDAYTSPLPSVTCVRPQDPRPEERLGYPSRDMSLATITQGALKEVIDACKIREIEYVMTHSSSAEAIDLERVAEMMAGKRSRMSFAPMVISTGNLMAFEAIACLLSKRSGAGHRGYFLNTRLARIERPRAWFVALFRLYFVRKFLKEMARA